MYPEIFFNYSKAALYMMFSKDKRTNEVPGELGVGCDFDAHRGLFSSSQKGGRVETTQTRWWRGPQQTSPVPVLRLQTAGLYPNTS